MSFLNEFDEVTAFQNAKKWHAETIQEGFDVAPEQHQLVLDYAKYAYEEINNFYQKNGDRAELLLKLSALAIGIILTFVEQFRIAINYPISLSLLCLVSTMILIILTLSPKSVSCLRPADGLINSAGQCSTNAMTAVIACEYYRATAGRIINNNRRTNALRVGYLLFCVGLSIFGFGLIAS